MGVFFKDLDGMEGILLPTVSIEIGGEAKTTSFLPGSRNLVVFESSPTSGSSKEVRAAVTEAKQAVLMARCAAALASETAESLDGLLEIERTDYSEIYGG